MALKSLRRGTSSNEIIYEKFSTLVAQISKSSVMKDVGKTNQNYRRFAWRLQGDHCEITFCLIVEAPMRDWWETSLFITE